MDSTKQLLQGYSTGFVKWWKVIWYEQKTDSAVSNKAHSHLHILSVQSSISRIIHFLFRAAYIPWQNGLTQIFRGNYGSGWLHSFHLVHQLVEISVRGLIAWHYCIPLLNNVCHMLHMRKYEVNTTVLWSDDNVNHMSSEILNNYPKANQPQWFQVIIVNVSVYMCFSVGLRSIIPSLATV
jgi:hypothetical protein